MSLSSNPLVSVIIAFYNEEVYLIEAIESVLLQSYDNWELLLVDDGSIESSTEIAKSYATAHPNKVFYIEHNGHTNKGVCASRNEGIKRANGELIAFLDADDVWLPEKLAYQVSIFQQHDIAMVVEASAYWSNDSSGQEILQIIEVGAPQNQIYQPFDLIQYLYPLSNGAAPCPSGIMLTKKAVERVNGFEESFTGQNQLYEDQAFLLKVYLNEKVYISSACNNKYRQHNASCVKQVHAKGKYHKVRRYFLEWLEKYLKSNNINNKVVHHRLNKALLPYRHPIYFFISDLLPTKMIRMFRKKINFQNASG